MSAITGLWVGSTAHAAIYVSTGTGAAGTSKNWNDPTLWTTNPTGEYPGATDTADTATVTLAAGSGANTINYTATTPFTLASVGLTPGSSTGDAVTLNIQSGQTLTTTGFFTVGTNSSAGQSAIVNVDGALNVGGNVTVNASGSSAINVNSGATYTAANTNLGSSAGAGHLYIMAGAGNVSLGSLNVNRIGGNSTNPGSITNSEADRGIHIRGGTVTANNFRIGTTNAAAISNISGGTLTISGAQFMVGNQSSNTNRFANFFQTGGTVTATNAAGLQIAVPGGSGTQATGRYEMSGGTLTVEKITLSSPLNVAGSQAIFTLGGTGSVYVGSGGIVSNNTAGAATINLAGSGATLGAKAPWTSASNMVLGTTGGNVQIKTADAANVAQNIGLAGVLSGAGGLDKVGGGVLELGGANTYAGNTNVNGGTLLATNATGSATGTGAVLVAPTTVLGGNGFIDPTLANAVTVNGILAPGSLLNAIDSLDILSDLALNGTLQSDVAGATADLVAVTGNIALGAASVLDLPATNAYDAGVTYTLATYTGTLTGEFTPPANVPASHVLSYGTRTNSAIMLVPVPEPTTLLALAAGSVALLGRRPRKI